MIWIKQNIRRIKRFVAWFPVIWKDEDWDSAHLLEIMRFKISHIRKEIDTNKRFVGYEKCVQQMKVAEILLERLAFSDFYTDYLSKDENCNCPEELFRWEPSSYDLNGKPITCKMISFTCDNCKRSSSWRYKKQLIKCKEDTDYLFWHLKKYMNKWWD